MYDLVRFFVGKIWQNISLYRSDFLTVILSFLKRERERDFAIVSDRLFCTV
jgi:hypothetical protein